MTKPFTKETGRLAGQSKGAIGAKGFVRPGVLLLDARHVAKTTEPTEGETEQRRWLRELKTKNSTAFFDRLLRMETEHKQAVKELRIAGIQGDKDKAEDAASMNVEKVKDVLEGLLAEFEAKNGPVHSERVDG